LRKYLKFVALTLLAVVVAYWFGRDLDWAQVREALQSSDWRLIAAAVVIVCVTYLLRALRWRALLAPLAPQVSLRELFAATTVGYGAIFLLGRAGEVARPAFLPLREPRVRPAASFVTIAIERIYDMVTVVLLFAANLLVMRMPAGGDVTLYARVREAGVVVLLAAVAGVAGLVLFRRYAGLVIGRLDALVGRMPDWAQRVGRVVTHLLEQLAQALGVLVDARELLVTIGWTALLWAGVASANLLVLRAFDLPYGMSETVFVMGWSLVGSLVPTPGGGAGTYHAATATGLVFLGATRTNAVAASIVLHLFGPFTSAFFVRRPLKNPTIERLNVELDPLRAGSQVLDDLGSGRGVALQFLRVLGGLFIRGASEDAAVEVVGEDCWGALPFLVFL
jgi:uncharacterized protein (TIRG00374 family)